LSTPDWLLPRLYALSTPSPHARSGDIPEHWPWRRERAEASACLATPPGPIGDDRRPAMELRRERYTTNLLDPRHGFEPIRAAVEVRWDPLTGQTCRLLPERSLPPPATQDLKALAKQSRASCPFCVERVERETPLFPTEVYPQGRIRIGEALLFPNLVPYAKWNSVSVYSPRRHLLRLEELTPSLIGDNLAAQVEFARAVIARDPASRWTSINANQLPPSGSSIFHPHLQGSANPVPTTAQRLFAELPPERLRKYVKLECAGERFIGGGGRVTWLASFAPIGLAEIRAVIAEAPSTIELDDDASAALAAGLSTVLGLYAELGFQSFNLALHGASNGTLLLRVVARAYFGPLQRSDVMWSERLHAEAATDLNPERIAEVARQLFAQAA
jgi:UDPglucose--hexose-1-phosphate uridylyltransferase